MSDPVIPFEHRASVTSSPNEGPAEKANQGTRNGFAVVVSHITKGIRNFFRKTPSATQSAAPSTHSASSENRLSVVSATKAFPEQYRQTCLSHLEKAAQERYALPGSDEFGILPDAFTTYYDGVFLNAFQESGLFQLPEICDAEIQTLLQHTKERTQLLILDDLHQARSRGKSSPELDQYIHFISLDKLEFPSSSAPAPMNAPDAPDEDIPPPLTQSPMPVLSEAGKEALRTTFEGILPDAPASECDPMPAPIVETECEPAPAIAPMPAPAPASRPTPEAQPASAAMAAAIENAPLTPGSANIVNRIFRTHVSARQMLIANNPGTTREERKAFEAFIADLDQSYKYAFDAYFNKLHPRHYSVSQAANEAAEKAYAATAKALLGTAVHTGYATGIRYAQDMSSKQHGVTKLALELFDGPKSIPAETASDAPHDLPAKGKKRTWMQMPQWMRIGTKAGKKAAKAGVISAAPVTALNAVADKNLLRGPEDLKATTMRLYMLFDRAREICVSVPTPESYRDIFADAFKARVINGSKPLKIRLAAGEELRKTWRFDVVHRAAKMATDNLAATMAACDDQEQKAFGKNLQRVRENLLKTVKDLDRATCMLSLEATHAALWPKKA